MGTNWNTGNVFKPDLKDFIVKLIEHWKQVAQRNYGFPIQEDIQNSTGEEGLAQPAVGDLALSWGWSRWSPDIPLTSATLCSL